MWVGSSADRDLSPSAQYTRERYAGRIGFHIATSSLGVSIVRQGLAKMVMPCFVGDAYNDLECISDPITELETERWIVVHQEQRQVPAIREAIDAITYFLTSQELTILP